VILSVAALAANAATGPEAIVLGKTSHTPASGCPATRGCQVVARLTGIQLSADGSGHPFLSPVKGRVIAWWLRLPQLRDSQMKSFSDLFGGAPAVRLSILRRVRHGHFRLVRQSATQTLSDYHGQKLWPFFSLPEPLQVNRGDYVGLTAVTWVPAFAVGLDSAGNSWLASRPKRRCNIPSSTDPKRFAAYYQATDAHAQAGSVKDYKCLYRTARLLYWALVVPDIAQTRGQ
jgi:hypothetical protein